MHAQSKLNFSVLLGFLAMAFLHGGVAAQPAAPAKAQVCAVCHGTNGISVSADVPNLAGQKAIYLQRQLTAFRDGTRVNGIMSAIAKQLDADDIRSLAAYWSGLDASTAANATSQTPVASQMAFPAAFPSGFTEYDRVQSESTKTIEVRYANAVALNAARARKPLPDGSYIVVATYAALLDASGQPQRADATHWRLGKATSYSAMESRAGWGDAVPELLRNGNWHYALWDESRQSRLGSAHAKCLACHKAKADDSYVFTLQQMQ